MQQIQRDLRTWNLALTLLKKQKKGTEEAYFNKETWKRERNLQRNYVRNGKKHFLKVHEISLLFCALKIIFFQTYDFNKFKISIRKKRNRKTKQVLKTFKKFWIDSNLIVFFYYYYYLELSLVGSANFGPCFAGIEFVRFLIRVEINLFFLLLNS